MRLIALLVGTSMLAACGGAGPETIGSAGTGTPTSGGTGGTGTTSDHSFVNPTQVKTYQGNGVYHRYSYDTEVNNLTGESSGQINQLYAGDASTVRSPNTTITYNPRDAIFDLTVSSGDSGVSATVRYQDPAHRTDFGGAVEPQIGTPNFAPSGILQGIQYLQVASGENSGRRFSDRLGLIVDLQNPSGSFDLTTFFYQRPGTKTKYVTYAGFLRNQLTANRVDVEATATTPASSITTNTFNISRGAFVFGENTLNSNVPKSGTGSYTGDMLATAVLNNRIDDLGRRDAPTYFQWIEGTANIGVNFGANTFSLDLNGTTFGPQLDIGTNGVNTVQSGATFTARGSGRIDLATAGGFLGQFQQAWFLNPDNSRLDLLIEGSSIDGAFYGPNGEEVAGNYRIVGGTPDERIDVLGIFTGARQ